MYISYALFPLLRASFMKLLYTLLTVRVNILTYLFTYLLNLTYLTYLTQLT